jgi:hypothetical protein
LAESAAADGCFAPTAGGVSLESAAPHSGQNLSSGSSSFLPHFAQYLMKSININPIKNTFAI